MAIIQREITDLQVFITENKHTDTVSTWSWGIADSSGNPVLMSIRAFNTEENATSNIQKLFAGWGLEIEGTL
jgi:hypothetical protein